MGPLAPADRPAASEPGGHLVNKMSVAKETEKPHRQLWLQLSGSFLLESFRISVLDLFCFSLPSKVKFRGKVSSCKMKKADWEAKLQAFCQVCLEFRCRSKSPCEATLPRFTAPAEASWTALCGFAFFPERLCCLVCSSTFSQYGIWLQLNCKRPYLTIN